MNPKNKTFIEGVNQ